jgi:hypothetical protein
MGVRAEEAGAYYEVLAHARDADIQKQKAAARKFLDERIENFRKEYEAQVRELLAKAEKYKSTEAEKFKRLRLGAKDLLVIRTQQFKKYKEDPASFPNFVDLFKNEKLYHGKLVTFHGHIRNLLSYSADKNDFGVTELHEAWIYTEDSRPNPAVIVCTSIPDGMQDAFNKSRVLDQVTVTGYFFKMFAFEDRDPDNKTRVAPMLIAQRLEWRPMDTEPITPQLKGTGLYAGICALAVSAVVLVWWISRRDRQFRVAHLQPASTTSPPDPDQETGDDHIGDDDN